MTVPRFLPKTPFDLERDLERATGLLRTEPPARTQNDVARLTRKRLGPSWGRKRRQRKTS